VDLKPLDTGGEASLLNTDTQAVSVPGTARVLQLIEFLSAFDAQKNPPVQNIADYRLWSLRDRSLPHHPAVKLDPAGLYWLGVDLVQLDPAPKPPARVATYFADYPQIRADLRPRPRARELDAQAVDGPEVDDAADAATKPMVVDPLQTEAEVWVSEVWKPWSKKWLLDRKVKDLHRDLFEQRDRLATDRDTYEIVWGFGRFRLTTQSGDKLDHPVLTIPVEVELDQKTRRVCVKPEGAFALETLFLAGVDIHDRAGLRTLDSTIADDPGSVGAWDEEAMTGLLRRYVQLVDHEGGIRGEIEADSETATVEPGWVLYVRRRRPDYQGFLQKLNDLYRNGATIPKPLQAVVVDSPSALESNDRQDEALLLPLPSNEEQRRIIHLAQDRPGVTVQGPPGTGKSHTIANIISHYVAHGRRVLVVAEKEQALQVLADKVPEEIRDLTVSVLGADAEGRKRLESSVRRIQSKVTSLDKAEARRNIERLEVHLDELDRSIAKTTDCLTMVRRSEVLTMPGEWRAGANPTPEVAARWIAENGYDLGYIIDPITPETPVAVTAGELTEAIELLKRIGLGKASVAVRPMPDVTQLPTGTDLANWSMTLREATEAYEAIKPLIADPERLDAATPEVLQHVAAALKTELDWFEANAEPWKNQVRSQLKDQALSETWTTFAHESRTKRDGLLKLRTRLESYEILVPSSPDEASLKALRDASKRLHKDGKLGWFSKDLKKVLSHCRVDGREPETGDEVELCLSRIDMARRRRQLRTSWNTAAGRVGGPQLSEVGGIVPEDEIGVHLDALDRILSWPDRISNLASQLAVTGLQIAGHPEPSDIKSILAAVESVPRRHQQLALQNYRTDLMAYLRRGESQPGASSIWLKLADAAEAWNHSRWDLLRAEIAGLADIAPDATKLLDIYGRLRDAAPRFAQSLDDSPSSARSPLTFEDAWQWRQLRTWVEAIGDAGDPAKLQHELDELSMQHRRTVTDLVAERAWYRLAENVGDRERQALNSYLQAVKRYGKTGGKFAARWLAEIRAALNEAKDAVPVWIMPTHRALTSFRPDSEPRFDVLIVDEASQLGLHSLPLLGLAHSTIVVGDDKQTSPDNVGLDRQAVFDLIDDHLAAIPKHKTLFDPDASLYDLAQQKFPDVVMLSEHFRSLPTIIGFSNTHSYNGDIVPLRDRLPTPDWRPLGTVKVEEGYRQGDINEPEAQAVVDLIAGLCEKPEYEGQTIGVIALLGKQQSKLIWDKLYDTIGPDVMADRSVRCGEAANFQGDERDVMVISTVVGIDPDRPDARIGAMTGRAAERRINVAASRAKNQMWVVHSVEPERFPDGDLRAELIRHCREEGSSELEVEQTEDRCESTFERDVLRAIRRKGFERVRTQYAVGRYRIDIVVEGNDSRLAIECDGDRWHGEDVWHRDRARQTVLERAGWTFERIRGSAFYLNPERSLLPLWARLDELGIGSGDV